MRISCAILGSALKKGVMGRQGSKSLRAGGQDQGLWVGAESGHFYHPGRVYGEWVFAGGGRCL